MSTQSTDLAGTIIADRDQTIASLRALLKAKDDEIADLKRDCSRLQGRIEQHEQQERRDSLAAWFP